MLLNISELIEDYYRALTVYRWSEQLTDFVNYKEDWNNYKTKFLNFSDKSSYLQWRQEWRELYKHLSIAIRFFKMNERTVRPKADWYSEDKFREYYRHYTDKYGCPSDGKALARFMMLLRMEAKQKSAQLRKTAVNPSI